MLEKLPLWLIVASLSVNAIFLRRLLAKLDLLYEWIVGTPKTPGMADRLRHVESMLDIDAHEMNRRRPPLETEEL